jgi:hypothetical protein
MSWGLNAYTPNGHLMFSSDDSSECYLYPPFELTIPRLENVRINYADYSADANGLFLLPNPSARFIASYHTPYPKVSYDASGATIHGESRELSVVVYIIGVY